jgi:hypothetical protein
MAMSGKAPALISTFDAQMKLPIRERVGMVLRSALSI